MHFALILLDWECVFCFHHNHSREVQGKLAPKGWLICKVLEYRALLLTSQIPWGLISFREGHITSLPWHVCCFYYCFRTNYIYWTKPNLNLLTTAPGQMYLVTSLILHLFLHLNIYTKFNTIYAAKHSVQNSKHVLNNNANCSTKNRNHISVCRLHLYTIYSGLLFLPFFRFI